MILKILMKKLLILFISLFAATAIADEFDSRQALTVTDAQRAKILHEMRALLTGTQNILAGLSNDDMAVVAQAASAIGMGMVEKVEDDVKAALPQEFRQLGMSVHQDFDRIAADAEALKDPKHTLQQLSQTMGKCIACHAGYQIGN